jgi:hypothetical protein
MAVSQIKHVLYTLDLLISRSLSGRICSDSSYWVIGMHVNSYFRSDSY